MKPILLLNKMWNQVFHELIAIDVENYKLILCREGFYRLDFDKKKDLLDKIRFEIYFMVKTNHLGWSGCEVVRMK